MTTLSVVIPAYNEEDGIEEIARRVLSIKDDLQKVGVEGLELIVVDDGSKDRTVEIAQSIEGVRLIQHEQNGGYGAALKTGFGKSVGELIGFLDADGTYPPEYFPKLCEEALMGTELVIGSRMSGDEESGMPITRRVGNFFFANLLSLIGGKRITDSASGMRVFHRNLLERIYPLPDGLNLTPVMSTRAVHEHVNMKEIPIPYSERLGRSKLSVVHDGTLFLQSMVWTALTYNPNRILGLIGLAAVILAGLIAAGVVGARVSGVTELGEWGVAAVFLVLVLIVAGISLYALGNTFNYMVMIFHKRPVRQGVLGENRSSPLGRPLNEYFGSLGFMAFILGVLVGIVSLVLVGNQSWEIERLWLWLLASAMSILVGIQLMIYWILLRVLETLGAREQMTKEDLGLL